MHYYIITASWHESQDVIQSLINPFATPNNFAILYNSDPEIDRVYIAAADKRMILAMKSEFELEETDSIDYGRDFMTSSNRQWGVIGNRSLVNF
jgi:hypothetical protein